MGWKGRLLDGMATERIFRKRGRGNVGGIHAHGDERAGRHGIWVLDGLEGAKY